MAKDLENLEEMDLPLSPDDLLRPKSEPAIVDEADEEVSEATEAEAPEEGEKNAPEEESPAEDAVEAEEVADEPDELQGETEVIFAPEEAPEDDGDVAAEKELFSDTGTFMPNSALAELAGSIRRVKADAGEEAELLLTLDTALAMIEAARTDMAEVSNIAMRAMFEPRTTTLEVGRLELVGATIDCTDAQVKSPTAAGAPAAAPAPSFTRQEIEELAPIPPDDDEQPPILTWALIVACAVLFGIVIASCILGVPPTAFFG